MADGAYTPSEVDRFTLADVNVLFSRWRDYPTLRTMVAAYLKIKPPAPASAQSGAVTSIAALKAMFPNGGIMRG